MWRVQYNYKQHGDEFFSVYRVSEDDFSPAQESAHDQLPVSTVHGSSACASDNNGFMIVDEIISDAENETTLHVTDHVGTRDKIKVGPLSPSFSSRLKFSPDVFKRHLESFDNGNAKKGIIERLEEDIKSPDNKTSVYENKRTVFLAVFVRFLLIGHNVVTAWRVTEAYNDNMYWLIVLTNLAIIVEGLVVIFRQGGIEYSWWCPCFLVYLASTIPSIWLLQLNQYDRFIASQRTAVTLTAAVTSSIGAASTTASTPISSMSSVVGIYSTEGTATTSVLVPSSITTSPSASAIGSTISLVLDMFSTAATEIITSLSNTTVTNTGKTETITSNASNSEAMGANISSTTDYSSSVSDLFSSNITDDTTVSVYDNTTIVPATKPNGLIKGMPDSDIWVIIVNESLVYLIVFGRWLLPRGRRVSRDFLADLLLEFLAIASDIMELLAVFDEDDVRGNLNLTYAILAVWSASFIQFIPILTQKKRFRKPRRPKVRCLTRLCGEKFVEFTVTCMSILLQDLPFLVVRLYIIIVVNLITYSLIFFLLKNIVSLMLLFYRLVIICHAMPFCKTRRS